MRSHVQFRERTFFWCRCVLTGVGLLAAVAQAQAQPLMYVEDARVFESNSGGSAILVFPVRFEGTQNNPVTVSVTATSASGVFFNGATGGTTCGAAGVDFEQFTSGPFTIPPNTPNGTLSINVRVCGDNAIEADEHVAVSLINVSGATVTPESGTAIGTIVNDDGPPGIQIRGLSASTLQGVSRTVNFTVSLHHPTA